METYSGKNLTIKGTKHMIKYVDTSYVKDTKTV